MEGTAQLHCNFRYWQQLGCKGKGATWDSKYAKLWCRSGSAWDPALLSIKSCAKLYYHTGTLKHDSLGSLDVCSLLPGALPTSRRISIRQLHWIGKWVDARRRYQQDNELCNRGASTETRKTISAYLDTLTTNSRPYCRVNWEPGMGRLVVRTWRRA